MEFITKVSTSNNASSVTFNSNGVWASYQDLILFVKMRSDSTSGYAGGRLFPNGISTSLGGMTLYSVGGNPISYTHSNGEIAFLSTSLNDTNLFSTGYIRLPNINDTSNHQIIGSRFFVANSSTNYDTWNISVNRWSQTTALTSFTIEATGGISNNSTFTLYGFRSGSGGGTITV